MIKSNIDVKNEMISVLLDGSYIDNLAELIVLVYAVCEKLAEENKLDRDKLIKDVLEVATEDLGEIGK